MGVMRNFASLGSNGNNDEDRELSLDEFIATHQNDVAVQNQAEEHPEDNAELMALERSHHRARRLREKQLRRSPLRPEATFSGLGCKGKSRKKYRRYENANLMAQSMNFLGMENEHLDDISIRDFIPESVSAFGQLLTEQDKMQMWNAFIDASEDEQQALIDGVSSDSEDEDDDEMKTRGCSLSDANDMRGKHPGFAGHDAFQRLNAEIKQMFKRKRVPLGLLASIEDDVLEAFITDPLAVYKSCLPSGYQRMLLHACCQYANLRCQSFDRKGTRWSKVRNPNASFEVPSIQLTKYLEEMTMLTR